VQIGPQTTTELHPRVNRGGYVVDLSGPYSYTFDWAALPHAGQAPTAKTVQIQNNTDFLWLGTSYFATEANAGFSRSGIVVPLVMVELLIAQEPFEASEHPLTGFAGSPEEGPRMQPAPFWIPGGTTVKMNARNFDAANDYNLWVTFWGVKYTAAHSQG